MLEIPTLTLHLIEDLRWLPHSLGTHNVSATLLLDDGYPVTVLASDLLAVQPDLDADAQAFIAVSRNDPRPTRLENRTIDGVEVWAAEATGEILRTYWVGGIHAGRQWTVSIEVPVTLADDDRVQLRERILASITFT